MSKALHEHGMGAESHGPIANHRSPDRGPPTRRNPALCSRWQHVLETYEAPPIEPATDEALRDYVARRKEALPDAWH